VSALVTNRIENHCDYCGLPIPPAWFGRKSTPAPTTAQYCCSGCRLAADLQRTESTDQPVNPWLVRILLSMFLTLNVFVVTMVLWSTDVYGEQALATSDNSQAQSLLTDIFRWLSLLLSLPVLWMLGGPLAEESWSRLKRGQLSSDLLLLLGVLAALLYSAVSIWKENGPIYCEVACVVLLLVTLGRWLESQGKQRAAAAIESLASLLPKQVQRLNGITSDQFSEAILSSATYSETSLSQLAVGDVLRILAGERIPVDGVILLGQAAIDEQVLSGESLPVTKSVHDPVRSGGLVVDGTLFIGCTAPAQQGSLARIIYEVRQAQAQQGRYQQLAERISAWFLPVVMFLALSSWGYFAWQGELMTGALRAMALVLIACPCALGIATPLAVWTALGRASQAQVLFRHGTALEQLASIRRIALDKTGTLTQGTVDLSSVVTHPDTTSELVMTMARRLAEHSTHPLSQSIVAATPSSSLLNQMQTSSLIKIQAGRGVWEIDEDHVRPLSALGSARFMDECGFAWSTELQALRIQQASSNQAVTYIGWAGQVQGALLFAELLRAGVAETLATLRQQGLQLTLLSGDEPARVIRCGEALGVEAHGGLLPAEKLHAIRNWQAQGETVLMVGDGINDAPALAAANLGMALGCGADVSRQTAQICLLGNDLTRIPWTIRLAQHTISIVRQNLIWAFLYNIVGIGMALFGYLNPVWAALFMVLSSLAVIANSWRLTSYPLPESNVALAPTATLITPTLSEVTT
jgi:heavy metal translocating P-type ATPase